MPSARDTGRTRAIPSTSRRHLLAGASAALVAGAALSAAKAAAAANSQSGDDAELLALVAQLHREHAALDAIEEEGDHLPPGITPASRDQERRMEAALDAREATWDAIATTAARTPAGMQAKAEALRSAVVFYAYSSSGETAEEIAEHGDTPERLALALVRDLLAWRTPA